MKKVKFSKLERKPGVKYIRCQHLVEKSQEAEHFSLWIGEKTRIILCPICHKVDLAGSIQLLKLMEIDRFHPHTEYANPMRWEGEEFVKSFWLEETKQFEPIRRTSKLRKIIDILFGESA